MSIQGIAILGSTGSIGIQALNVLRKTGHQYKIKLLVANRNYKLLAQQVNEFNPEWVIIGKKEYLEPLKNMVNNKASVFSGKEDLISRIVEHENIDVILNALVGFVGFMPTYTALKKGKKLLLANKESLVVGGEFFEKNIPKYRDHLIPIDSEHSAILQCLQSESKSMIDSITLTASGGAIRDMDINTLKKISAKDILKHPNWQMGKKITVDSSTLINKGLELIEAQFMFGIQPSQLRAVIHRESIVHGLVSFRDGATIAHLGYPDMTIPIHYAIHYPKRCSYHVPSLDLTEISKLQFEPIDMKRYPCYPLCLDVMNHGKYAPLILNAANEVAVERYLNGEIGYLDIYRCIDSALNKFIHISHAMCTDTFIYINKEVQGYTRTLSF